MVKRNEKFKVEVSMVKRNEEFKIGDSVKFEFDDDGGEHITGTGKVNGLNPVTKALSVSVEQSSSDGISVGDDITVSADELKPNENRSCMRKRFKNEEFTIGDPDNNPIGIGDLVEWVDIWTVIDITNDQCKLMDFTGRETWVDLNAVTKKGTIGIGDRVNWVSDMWTVTDTIGGGYKLMDNMGHEAWATSDAITKEGSDSTIGIGDRIEWVSNKWKVVDITDGQYVLKDNRGHEAWARYDAITRGNIKLFDNVEWVSNKWKVVDITDGQCKLVNNMGHVAWAPSNTIVKISESKKKRFKNEDLAVGDYYRDDNGTAYPVTDSRGEGDDIEVKVNNKWVKSKGEIPYRGAMGDYSDYESLIKRSERFCTEMDAIINDLIDDDKIDKKANGRVPASQGDSLKVEERIRIPIPQDDDKVTVNIDGKYKSGIVRYIGNEKNILVVLSTDERVWISPYDIVDIQGESKKKEGIQFKTKKKEGIQFKKKSESNGFREGDKVTVNIDGKYKSGIVSDVDDEDGILVLFPPDEYEWISPDDIVDNQGESRKKSEDMPGYPTYSRGPTKEDDIKILRELNNRRGGYISAREMDELGLSYIFESGDEADAYQDTLHRRLGESPFPDYIAFADALEAGDWESKPSKHKIKKESQSPMLVI